MLCAVCCVVVSRAFAVRTDYALSGIARLYHAAHKMLLIYHSLQSHSQTLALVRFVRLLASFALCRSFYFPSSSSSELLLLVVVVACVQFSRRSFWLYPSGSSSHTTLRIELPTVAFYVCATRLQGNSTVSEQLGCFVWVPMGSEAVLKLVCCLLKNRNRLGHLVQSTLHDFKVAYYGGVAGVRNRVFLLNHRASTGVTNFLLDNGDGWSVNHIIQST